MKKFLAVLTGIMVVAGLASAMPSIYGTSGLFRVYSAENTGAMTFGLGFHGVGWMKDSTEFHAYADKNVEVYPAGYFALSNMFEISVAPLYNWYKPKPWFSGAGGANGLYDTRFGLKTSFKAGDKMNLGIYLGYDIPTKGMMDSLLEVKDPAKHMGTVHVRGLFGYNFGKGDIYLNAGWGYKLDKVADASTVDTTDNVAIYPNTGFPFGLGFRYKLHDYVTFLFEVTGKAGIDSNKYYKANGGTTVETDVSRGVMNNPLLITPGFRFTFPFGLNLDLGFDYNMQAKDTLFLSPYDPNSTNPAIRAGAAAYKIGYAGSELNRQYDWQVIAGLSYATVKAKGPKVPATGSIAGKVTDKAGKALAAVVTAGGLTANTDPATGAYTIAGLTIGATPVEVKADAKGFIAKSSSVMLTKKNKKVPAPQDFVLEPKPIPMSDVTGIVTDYKDGKPMANATLTFKGPKTVTAKSDAAGKYTAKLEPGNYQVTIDAAGYKSFTANVVAKDGKPVAQDIGLVKVAEKFAFSNIFFPVGKATITPQAETVLEQIAKILKDHPELKVELGGHTDNIGGKAKNLKLSQARAESVMNWLVTKGIAGSQMTAKGYGSSMPIDTNKTRAGREKNRRIEVTVVQ